MANSNEASVEEILESIKKVIARDNRDDAMATRRRRETAGMPETLPAATEAAAAAVDAETEDEVLDLAEMEFLEDIDETEADTADKSVGEAEPADDTNHDSHIEDDTGSDTDTDAGPLTTDEARTSMRENLEALAMLAQPSVPPQIVRSGETSLEGLTRELMRPMLSEWLDANLPDMVETMVKEEIARIARKDS